MKRRVKFISVSIIEYREYEEFLNRMGSQGWHPVHINGLFQIFEFQPDKILYYSVVPNMKISGSALVNDYQKHREMIESFGYNWYKSAGDVGIYTSELQSQIYTDAEIDQYELLRLMKSRRRSFIFDIIMNIVVLGFFILKPRNFFLSSMLQILMVSYLLSMRRALSWIMSYVRLRKGTYTPHKTKFKSLKNDIASNIWSISYGLILILFMIDSIYGFGFIPTFYYLLIFAIVILSVVGIDRWLSTSSSFKESRPGLIALIVTSLIIFAILVASKIETQQLNHSLPANLKELGCSETSFQYTKRSFIVQSYQMECNGQAYTLYEFKLPFGKSTLRNIILDQSTKVVEGVVSEVIDKQFDVKMYVLVFGDYMVTSYKLITQTQAQQIIRDN